MIRHSQADIEKRRRIWHSLFVQGRQAYIKFISDQLLDGKEYFTFVARKNGSFFFLPVLWTNPEVCKLILFNSFTVMREFRQAFELARNFVNTCQLVYNFLFSLPREILENLRPFEIEFVGATEHRRRFKAKGRAFSSLLGFDRPVKLIYK